MIPKTLIVAAIFLAVIMTAGLGLEFINGLGQAAMDPGFPCPFGGCETHIGYSVTSYAVGMLFMFVFGLCFIVLALTQRRAV